MFHRALLALTIGLAALGFLLAVLSQCYWLARAWRLAGLLRSSAARKVLHAAVILAVAGMILLAAVSMIRNGRGVVSFGSWWNVVLGLWLTSSIVSYVFIKLVAAMEWTWRRMNPKSSIQHSSASSRGVAARRVPADAAEREAAEREIDPSRRNFFRFAGILAGAVPFASAIYGCASERLRFQVREVEIPIPNLSVGLDGLRIAQLSDIHIGSYMPVDEVRRAVSMANELRGDIAIVTGDFITSRNDPLEACIAELSQLRAPLGVWGCNGNHEIYANAEAEAQRLFQRFGMRLLRQENAELRWGGNAFNLIGVDYQAQHPYEGHKTAMLSGVETMVRRDIPNILLSHNPNSFPRAAELGIELSLAGHTHGGQVRVEILDHRWSPAQFLTPYVAGLYRRPMFTPSRLTENDLAALNPSSEFRFAAASAIYVNRGLGTIGAPVRLGVPPEITLIKLRRA